MWQETQTLIGIILWCFFICSCVLGLKIGLSRSLIYVVNSMFEQDLIDSQADGLDKDVIDRLSNIEKYTILRADSSIFSIRDNKDD